MTECGQNSEKLRPGRRTRGSFVQLLFPLVGRYDGDGVMDMGHTTPNDTNDDLIIPIQFYVFVGEVEFTGQFLNRVTETLPKTI